jgi:hypothetical protein
MWRALARRSAPGNYFVERHALRVDSQISLIYIINVKLMQSKMVEIAIDTLQTAIDT